MANTPYIDLVKPAGTDKALISVLNANSDKIDSAVGGVQDALAIVCNGNTHGAITSGQYVYVRAHETLQEGLYKANSNIAANAALNSTNLTADSSGGLNSLNEQIKNLGEGEFPVGVSIGIAVSGKQVRFFIPFYTNHIPNISIRTFGITNVLPTDETYASRCTLISKSIHGASYRYDDPDNIFTTNQTYCCNLEFSLS